MSKSTMWANEIYEPISEALTLSPEEAAPMEHDPRQLRNTLGNFATGVCVITYESAGAYYGMTVNSFTSVSMDPPLVLISLMRTSRALAYLTERPFAVNIMGKDELDTVMHFAGKPLDGEPIEWVTDETAPRLNNSLAFFQCTPWAAHDGGDHVLILGKVLSYGQRDADQPLVFYRGQWKELAVEDGS